MVDSKAESLSIKNFKFKVKIFGHVLTDSEISADTDLGPQSHACGTAVRLEPDYPAGNWNVTGIPLLVINKIRI
jgi:hypothetical protein